ncbi:hypothetical protein [Okeania sp. SIO2B9]|nr:hypothetical protein [Okeania sp. SIO2B9]
MVKEAPGVWEKLKNIYPHHYHAGLPAIFANHLPRGGNYSGFH